MRIENRTTSIICVVLTYNNSENIKKLLQNLYLQTYPLSEIVVVDNASKDDTVEIIKSNFPEVTLLNSQINLGVGEGYNRGIEYALQKKCDWTWFLDGDSIPELNALGELITAFNFLKEQEEIGILASCRRNPISDKFEGGEIFNHRILSYRPTELYSKIPYQVDSTITSGSLINKKVIEKAGLFREDFFIDFIDHEYSFRVRKAGYKIFSVPRSIINHQIGKIRIVKSIKKLFKPVYSSLHSPWRLYYQSRNVLYTYLYELRDKRAFLLFWIDFFRKILSIIIHDNQKFLRIKLWTLGCFDAFRKKLGKVIDPESL